MHLGRAFRMLTGGIIAAVGIQDVHKRHTASAITQSNRDAASNSTFRGLLAHAETKVKITPWDWNWDNRQLTDVSDNSAASPSTSRVSVASKGDTDEGKQRAKATRHLFLIRHGQYHYADDDADCHLTPLGREQLNFTGVRLKYLNYPYKILHYSTMTRAIESTEEVMKHLITVQVKPTDHLREGAPYQLEPPLSYYQPTEKQLLEEGRRIEAAFKQHVHRAEATQVEDSYEILVCHGNVIRYFVCRALQLPPEAWIRFSLDHGSITWLVVRPDGRVVLRWLGNSGHMPPDKISVN